MLGRLTFDTTNADTIADSANVGAYLRSDDGTLLTHHTVGADEGLDVYLLNSSITVEATDLDIRALTQSDEITAYQGTSPWVVSATDLDIRDLTAASDNVGAWLNDGSGTAITSTTVGSDQALDVNVVEGVNVEVDLNHADDSVALGDGTDLFTSTTIGSDIGLDVNVINDGSVSNSSIASAANNVGTADTPEDLVSSPLSNRKMLFVYNEGNRTIYIGPSGVSASDGFPIDPKTFMELKAGAAVDIEFVGASGASGANSTGVRTLELS